MPVERLRFEGRWVFDTASALGGLYLGDEAGDDLARDAKLGLDALLVERPRVAWPGSKRVVGRVLSGGDDRSPSVVWHAQAIGTLLELGFMPTAECVRVHLDVIAQRLDPTNAVEPGLVEPESLWVLRTRHVAWALACLAELDAQTIPREDVPEEVTEAMHAYEQTALSAFRYLTDDDGPGAWTSVRQGERYWSEHWGSRRENLLNSIYATLAICRASRHGFRAPRSSAWEADFPVEQTIHSFVDGISIETTPEGPRARLAGGWVEPWACEHLPPGVVGLLVLMLNEYAHLLLGIATPRSRLESRARASHVLARRLAHDLVSRADAWTTSVDAFSYAGAEGGWWIVPSYSVCLRAILESGAVEPNHEVVEAAFATVQRFARVATAADGTEYQTWGDPTRGDLPASIPPDDGSWHATVDLAGVDAAHTQPTASSIHASAMAYAALRRASHAADPRHLHNPIPDDRPPASPFNVLQATEAGGDWRLRLRAGDDYEEEIEISSGRAHLLRACVELGVPASYAELAEYVRATWPDAVRLTREAEGVRGAIRELNESLGVQLFHVAIAADGPRVTVPATLEWSPDPAAKRAKRTSKLLKGRGSRPAVR